MTILLYTYYGSLRDLVVIFSSSHPMACLSTVRTFSMSFFPRVGGNPVTFNVIPRALVAVSQDSVCNNKIPWSSRGMTGGKSSHAAKPTAPRNDDSASMQQNLE
ncbi:MAG TPA: hypothetical protein LFV92_05910 [Rickettsia endosymbiont of Ceroptres masudai]|nr:hypothetical protein [Rickettsia endosymbiont of Ceroptres masudai]